MAEADCRFGPFAPGYMQADAGVQLRLPKFATRFAPALALLILSALSYRAQSPGSPSAAKPVLQSNYDAAQTFQANGDFAQASLQYQLFIASALDRLAIARGNIGDHGRSSALFNEALRLTPNNHGLQLDSAEEAFASKEPARARLLAEKALAAEPGNARAHRILGRVLVEAGENERGTKELEKAVAIEPDFTNGYALASAYLAIKDKERAAGIFREMQASFGDKAAIHMQFGLAYGEAEFFEDASREFQKTIEEDPKFPGAHYSLGASCLLTVGEVDFTRAEAEFRKELQINPDDFLSHMQLGSIALSQHRPQDAEHELTRANALNPINADAFLLLGQLYAETGRNADAEAALRKSIALTPEVSHNRYQVQRAHYLLARVLFQTNRTEDGKREMQISQELLSLSASKHREPSHSTSENDLGGVAPWSGGKNTAQFDPHALSAAEADEKQLGPAIADSYNNMGVIAATSNDFAAASDYFEKASQWNPTLEGLDYNWGKAAYSGHLSSKAVGPLGRYVQSHPEDDSMRAALGMSLFLIRDYDRSVKALEPIASRSDATPALAFLYAQSLVEIGEYESGIVRLRALIANDPRSVPYHRALGEALAHKKDYSGAAAEFQTSLQIDPSDNRSKYYLALTFIQQQQTKSAQGYLEELAQSGSKNPDVYYQLGKLKFEEADAKSAILSLQQAAKLSPGSELIHKALAAAYRMDSRTEDADSEIKQAEAIHTSRGPATESSHEN